MKLRLIYRAEPGVRFAPEAWVNNVGKEVSLNLPDGTRRRALITAVSQTGDEWAIELTAEYDRALAKAAEVTIPPGTERLAVALRITEPEEVTPTRPRVELKRLRLPLEQHGSELLLVGDRFEGNGRYVSMEVARRESASWTWLEWDNAYDALAEQWMNRYGRR